MCGMVADGRFRFGFGRSRSGGRVPSSRSGGRMQLSPANPARACGGGFSLSLFCHVSSVHKRAMVVCDPFFCTDFHVQEACVCEEFFCTDDGGVHACVCAGVCESCRCLPRRCACVCVCVPSVVTSLASPLLSVLLLPLPRLPSSCRRGRPTTHTRLCKAADDDEAAVEAAAGAERGGSPHRRKCDVQCIRGTWLLLLLLHYYYSPRPPPPLQRRLVLVQGSMGGHLGGLRHVCQPPGELGACVTCVCDLPLRCGHLGGLHHVCRRPAAALRSPWGACVTCVCRPVRWDQQRPRLCHVCLHMS